MLRRPAVLWMTVWISLLSLGTLPATGAGAELRFQSDTLLRAFERDVGGGDGFALPLYEYLQADYGRAGEEAVTFHLYGWGRIDLSGGDYFEERFGGGRDTAGELLYGYLQYAPSDSPLTARLGRLHLFEGGANESIDGVRISADLGDLFSVSAYGGWPVALDASDGRSGDSLYGGRLSHHRRGLYQIALSYKNVGNDGDRQEEMLGIDFSLFLPKGVSLAGLSTRNLRTEGWAEHFYEARFTFGNFELRPFFEHFRYEDYFGTGENTGNPFRFLPGLRDRLTVIGADLLWQQSDRWEWGVKGKHYDHDERGGSSQFVSGVGIWHGEEGLSQAGGELGVMNGDRAEDRYLLGRIFIWCDGLTIPVLRFVTADLVGAWYDEKIYGERGSLFVSVGGGTRLLGDALELKVSVDGSTDPYFDSELRGWLMARYAFTL